MFRTQIYITESERQGLSLLSKELGLGQSALIREAIDEYLERKGKEKNRTRKRLKEAAGLWKKRNDLPDFTSLREEWDRGEEQ